MNQVTVISALVMFIALLLPVVNNALRRRPRLLAAVKYGILIVYIAANLYETLLFRTMGETSVIKTELFWSYRKALNMPDGLMSLINGTVKIKRPDLWEAILLNILLYIPLGYLLPFVFERLKGWQVVLIAIGCSVLTEIIQLVFHLGCFEFDDIINNALGSIMGLAVYLCVIRRRMKNR